MPYNSLIATTLRLPFSGYRYWEDGYYGAQSRYAIYWSSSSNLAGSDNFSFNTRDNIINTSSHYSDSKKDGFGRAA
jgi:hypothetical protein